MAPAERQPIMAAQETPTKGASMPTVYHFHTDVGSHGDLNCGALNGHDASCSTGLMTDANEGLCQVVTQGFPLGKPHKCTHDISSAQLEALLDRVGEIDFWVLEP